MAEREIRGERINYNTSVFDIPIKMLPPDEIGQFFHSIEAKKKILGVTEYSLTQATLDHVFINFNAQQADESSIVLTH
jgi:hypothetical protein